MHDFMKFISFNLKQTIYKILNKIYFLNDSGKIRLISALEKNCSSSFFRAFFAFR